MNSSSKTVSTLRRLRSIQNNLGRQLEKAYIRNQVSDYLVMEKRQRKISLLIDKLWGQLDEKGRSMMRQSQNRSFF